MRIEDSYTVAAPAEQAYGALLTAEALARALPGCERLIQLGPAGEDGAVSFEARLRAEASPWTLSLRLRGGRRRDRIEVSLRVLGTGGAYTGRGAITLVRHIGQTLLSYSLAVEGPSGAAAETSNEAALQALARGCCERFAAALAEPPTPSGDTLERRRPVTTEVQALEGPRLRQVGQRAVWMGGGLIVGVVALGLVTNLVRRLASRG